MYKKYLLHKILAVLFIVTALSSYAQVNSTDTSGKILDIIWADRLTSKKIDGVGEFLSVAGNVRMRQGTTLFYCDSAVLNQTANTFQA
ncbi:MAG: hypothetical protein H0U39_04870, partial [Segetibacter sp.]|nr:hypothetical protein [Segetibacter sp.]